MSTPLGRFGQFACAAALLAAIVGCGQAPPQSASSPAGALQAGEGFLDFPGGKVWYRISGSGSATPLLVLHGGPGAGSYYLESLDRISGERPVVYYDQFGAGRSDRAADVSSYSMEASTEEVGRVRNALGLDAIHLFGHSWGAMLAIEYLDTNPPGVKSVVLASMAPSAEQWLADTKKLVSTLPAEDQAIIVKHEADGTYDAEEYQAAVEEFNKRYLSLKLQESPPPQPLQDMFANFEADVYRAMWGPSEFTATGPLKDWDAREKLRRIEIPALVTVADHDEMSIDSARDMVARLPNARLEIIENSGHLTPIDQPEAYAEVVGSFLREVGGQAP